MTEIYLTHRISLEGSEKLEVIRDYGAYATAEQVIKSLEPDQVIELVKASGLRGRGGAGFPTGVKWGFMPKGHQGPRYLGVNADEGEPGTCKDRIIMEQDPHLLIEGIVIACFAIRAEHAYIYIRGEYLKSYRVLADAIAEAEEAGVLGDDVFGCRGLSIRVHLHRGAGAYICGEETSLMESLEGRRGHPRPKPPFPAIAGLWGMPTAINNVETIANLPAILDKGVEWYRSLGTKNSPGNLLFGVSGHVLNPGVFELPMGTTVKELIYEHCNGMRGDLPLKSFCPGGSSTGFLPASAVDTPMDHDSLMGVGSMLGTGGLIVMDESVKIPEALEVLAAFYHHETCGQCPPCRESCAWCHVILKRMLSGKGKPKDLEMLQEIFNMSCGGKTICVFPDALGVPVRTALKHFREEFEALINKGSVKTNAVA
ncbi:MAG: NADH-quinone oxidoreductase subunit NuoF [Planctomycetota bacterium]